MYKLKKEGEFQVIEIRKIMGKNSDKGKMRVQDAIEKFVKAYLDAQKASKDFGTKPDKLYEAGSKRREYETGSEGLVNGNSAFSPVIIAVNVADYGQPAVYKYYIALHKCGKFDSHMNDNIKFDGKKEESKLPDMVEKQVSGPQYGRAIDITGLSNDKILEILRNILEMTNEEVMKAFGISSIYDSRVKLELVLADKIQEYFDEHDDEVRSDTYAAERGIFIKGSKNDIFLKHIGVGDTINVHIVDETQKCDEFSCKVLNPDETDLDKMRVKILLRPGNSELKVETELGKLLLQTLRERFNAREQDVKQEQKSGPGQEMPGSGGLLNSEVVNAAGTVGLRALRGAMGAVVFGTGIQIGNKDDKGVK